MLGSKGACYGITMKDERLDVLMMVGSTYQDHSNYLLIIKRAI